MALKSMSVPTRNYQVGSNDIPAQTVPAGVTSMLITLNTANWTNPASRLLITMELQQDGGNTWLSGGATDMQCRPDGTFRNRDGAILATVSAFFMWPSSTTHIRGNFAVEGATIRTGGTIEVN